MNTNNEIIRRYDEVLSMKASTITLDKKLELQIDYIDEQILIVKNKGYENL